MPAILNFVVAMVREIKQRLDRAVLVPYGEEPINGQELLDLRDDVLAAQAAAEAAHVAAETAAALLT